MDCESSLHTTWTRRDEVWERETHCPEPGPGLGMPLVGGGRTSEGERFLRGGGEWDEAGMRETLQEAAVALSDLTSCVLPAVGNHERVVSRGRGVIRLF